MSDCLFCKMVAGEIEPDVVYQDDDLLAFRDINPQAPVHILIIPKQHISTLNDFNDENIQLIGKMTLLAKQLATQEGIADEGYRIAINCNDKGGQDIFHLHMHLLGGRQMRWPPG
ncbi:MAG: histidine triad nucleotide-binding protein [Gammaproteobacteria bacterium]|nr:histidine triad nucleotide-binding protein [Gammaproteobacteria bacterium]